MGALDRHSVLSHPPTGLSLNFNEGGAEAREGTLKTEVGVGRGCGKSGVIAGRGWLVPHR